MLKWWILKIVIWDSIFIEVLKKFQCKQDMIII
jgi:hypothetical protein